MTNEGIFNCKFEVFFVPHGGGTRLKKCIELIRGLVNNLSKLIAFPYLTQEVIILSLVDE